MSLAIPLGQALNMTAWLTGRHHGLSDQMTIQRLDELMPGMVLASDARCLNGRVLLRAGATLTEHHLRIFRIWGLADADIDSDDAQGTQSNRPEVISPERMQRVRAALNERFIHADANHPLIAELYRWCLQHAAEDTQG